MANPLSNYGVSDSDYRTAVGTLMGEGLGQGVKGYAAIADVLANRMENPSAYGARTGTITGVATAPGQFDAWNGGNSRTRGGNINAKMGFAAALDPSLATSLGITNEISQIDEALTGVFGTGSYRGLTQGATFYSNPAVTAQWGTAGYQGRLANQYGSVQIGDHLFTGPGFNPDKPFDFEAARVQNQVGLAGLPADLYGLNPPELNLAAPDLPGALGGFGNIDSLSVNVPDVPSLQGQIPGPDYGDITAGLYGDPGNINVTNVPDVMGQFDGPTYPDFSAGLYDPGLVNVPGVPDPMTTMDGPTYPGLSDGLYPGTPAADVSVPSPPDVGGLYGLDVQGPPQPVGGYHAGLGEDPYGLSGYDFSQPSTAEKEAFRSVSDPITSYSYDSFTHGINGALMNELSPKQETQTVSVPETYTAYETRTKDVPFSAPNSLQDAYMGEWADKLGPPNVTQPSVRTITEQVPVQKTRMVEKTVPVALPSQMPVENASLPGTPAQGLGAQYGMGQSGFDSFLGSTGLGASFGDGPYAVSNYNDAYDKYSKDFGLPDRVGLVEGFQNDYGKVSPMGQGFMTGMLTGGPLGAITGAATGYAKGKIGDMLGLDDGFGIHSMLGLPANPLTSIFSGIGNLLGGSESYNGGLEGGNPGSMSSYGTPYDDAGLAMPHDAYFSGGYDAVQGFYDGGGAPGSRTSQGGGTMGGDPSQDGGARYGGW